MKRMLCLLAVFCLLLALVPAPVWAETAARTQKMSASPAVVNENAPKKSGTGNPLYDDVQEPAEAELDYPVSAADYDPNAPAPEDPTEPEILTEPAIPDLDLPECLDSEWEVLWLTNRERHKAGLEPVTTQDILFQAAGIRAEEITERFEHFRPDESEYTTVFFDVGYPWYRAGENISAGPQTPSEAVDGWMNSEDHRVHILDPEFTHLGVGYVPHDDPYAHYWTQLFAVGWEYQYTDLELCTQVLEVEAGTELEAIPLWAKVNCTYCGECYLPILPEYCQGYNPEKSGTQTVTVTCLGLTDTLQITVLDAEPEDPTDPEPDAQPGDANGDGTINILDLIALRQHLADWDVKIAPTGVDANGDGTTNILDLIILRQYLADWDVTLGPQP